ncbi:hypothetical protein [Alkalihalobacterium chitinilyticum]|uniref:DUF2524 family protein n=1 Tax=Alkalihalobacterium chitinilyticum TaxID=2980103 RepID=A0ABT5VKN1_9BACI|nr:hypothetical protein [Alkalihalobacterium chitinilyticum]MDE5415003.1 hypothetical protein [Alkalihalobacterium chitinilyticum]
MTQSQNEVVHQSILAMQRALQALQTKDQNPNLMYDAENKLQDLMRQLKEEEKSAVPQIQQEILQTEQQIQAMLYELNHQLHQQQEL